MESSATSQTAPVNAFNRLARSYAEVAAQIPEGTHHGTSVEGTRREAQRRHLGISPVPHCLPKTGWGERRFRCLAKDHQVKDCRELIKCLECEQSGRRRTSCPHRSPQPKTGAARHSATSLFAYLVGEVRGSIPTRDHILSGLHVLLPELGIPNCHRIASGDIFLRNLSQTAWQYLRG